MIDAVNDGTIRLLLPENTVAMMSGEVLLLCQDRA